jgi:NADH-quinone oxidoreductase subunit N
VTTVTALDWLALVPALIVMFTGFFVVGVDLFRGHEGDGRPRGHLAVLSFAGVAGSAWVLWQRLSAGRRAIRAFDGALVLDDLACFLSLAVLAATALVIVGAEADTRRRKVAVGEYYGLVLLASSGMMLLLSANDFLSMFLTLEITSLALYVLTGITRKSPRSNEAAVKYLVTGAFATCFLLLGVGFLFGASGSIEYAAIGKVMAVSHSPLLTVGFGLVLVGFCFKIGAVPFHQWVADVYEGAPTTSTAYMSVTVKAAGVGALARVLTTVGPGATELWGDLLWWVAVATMVLGNLLTLGQTSVKRMLAYSSIAHTGYALVALASLVSTGGELGGDSLAGLAFYLFGYTFMTLGAFVVLVYLGHEVTHADGTVEWQDAETFDDLAGVARRRPWAAFAMTLFVVSLGGIPPTVGFVGKYLVFAAAVAQGHWVLALIGVTASLVSLYYYLQVVVAMYFLDPVSEDEVPNRQIGAVVALSAVAVLLFGILPSTFVDWATRAVDLVK